MDPESDGGARARRALLQRLELERGFGADVLPRKRRPAAAAPQPAAGGPAAPPRAGDGAKSAPSRPGPASRPVAARDPVLDLPEEARGKFMALRDEALACTKCRLCKTRTQVVFGTGTPRAEVMFVGEAPGADEDAQGEPFVGRAGQLLTRTLTELGVPRATVYIGNIVKCRPPDNRKPEADEMSQCFPYLRRQIDLIEPRFLCALGSVAAQALTGRVESITRIRGQLRDYPWRPGLKIMPTFHPAYLLRSMGEMPKFKEDLRRLFEMVKQIRPPAR